MEMRCMLTDSLVLGDLDCPRPGICAEQSFLCMHKPQSRFSLHLVHSCCP